MEDEKKRIWRDSFVVAEAFENNIDIAIMRAKYTEEFRHYFNMGYQNYSQGEWRVAQKYLDRTHKMFTMQTGTYDGPSGALLSFMENPYQFEAPENWQGVHDLSDL